MPLRIDIIRYRGDAAREPVSVLFDREGGSIGRSADCSLVLPDDCVSRKHARISFSAGRYHLTDESANGTLIANRDFLVHYERVELEEGDILRIGDYDLEVNYVERESLQGQSNGRPMTDDRPARRDSRPRLDIPPEKGTPLEPRRTGPSLFLKELSIDDFFRDTENEIPTPVGEKVCEPPIHSGGGRQEQEIQLDERKVDDFFKNIDDFFSDSIEEERGAKTGGRQDISERTGPEPPRIQQPPPPPPARDASPARGMTPPRGFQAVESAGPRESVSRAGPPDLTDPVRPAFEDRADPGVSKPARPAFPDRTDPIREAVCTPPRDRTEPITAQPVLPAAEDREGPILSKPARPAIADRTDPIMEAVLPPAEDWTEPVTARPASPGVKDRTDPIMPQPVRPTPRGRTDPIVSKPKPAAPVDRTDPVMQTPGVTARPDPELIAPQDLEQLRAPAPPAAEPAPPVSAAAPPRPGTSPAVPASGAPPVGAPAAGEADIQKIREELFKLFIKGARLEGESFFKPEDISSIMETLGAVFRELATGLYTVLRGRTELKAEFRLAMTMVRPFCNNPLKMSPRVEDVLKRLLKRDHPSFLEPVDAVREGFEDLMNHQMAMNAGMRATLSEALDRFDPERFAGKQKDSLFLTKGKYWKDYCDSYEKLREQAVDEIFGKAFIKAYEEQLERLRSSKKKN